jgi:hypothetical protein
MRINEDKNQDEDITTFSSLNVKVLAAMKERRIVLVGVVMECCPLMLKRL